MKTHPLIQAQARVIGLLKSGNRVFALDLAPTPGTFAQIERPGLPPIPVAHATIMALRSRRLIVQKRTDHPRARFEYTLPEETA